MAKKPIVAVDVDDVLIVNGDALVSYLNKKLGKEFQAESWYEMDEMVNFYGKTKQEMLDIIHAYVKSDEFRSIGPVTESIEVLGQLKDEYELVVITARPAIIHNFTKEWLGQHFPNTFGGIHFANPKYEWGTFADTTKSKLCLEIGVGYLIDDALHNIEDAAAAGIKGLLFGEYPWNKAERLPPNVRRVENWQAVARELL